MTTAPLLTLFLLVPGAAAGKTDTYPRPELLMEPAELAKPEVARKYRILDARSKKAYEAGHIPGAVWIDHDTWSKAFAAGQDPSDWIPRIMKLGIGDRTPVVVYDDDRGNRAARMWWILKYWGVSDARLLNGQWKTWKAEGRPVSKEATPPTPLRFTGVTRESKRLTTKKQLLKALPGSTLQIIDARSEGEFCGTTKLAKRGGSIPGARHLEWTDTLDPKTQRFKSAPELRQLFRQAGIDPKRPSVTYCQSGGRAAVMAFVLELMGAHDVRNYYRSWAEWGNAQDTPVARPKENK
jgi:thiosulfate/3-mercaptopyruvate sulfurtransferase